MRSVLTHLGVALLFGAARSACSGDGVLVTQPNGSGELSLALTDAPSDSITAAVVTITDIYLQPGSDSLATADRVYLRQNSKTTVNLLTLRDSLKSMVQSATVPAGSYSQLRLVITGAYIQVRNADGGSSIYATSTSYEGLPAGAQVAGTLVAPSYAQSGLKVLLPNSSLDVSNGSSTSLVADFDVAQSFGHQAGASNRWVLSPVVKAVSQSGTATLTVNVALASGVTLPTGVVLSGFQVQLRDASGNARTAALNASGSATFQALVPTNGPFSLTLLAPAGVTLAATPVLPLTVNLNAGANTQAITITSVH